MYSGVEILNLELNTNANYYEHKFDGHRQYHTWINNLSLVQPSGIGITYTKEHNARGRHKKKIKQNQINNIRVKQGNNLSKKDIQLPHHARIEHREIWGLCRREIKAFTLPERYTV